jgi:hypothetical protein
MRTCMSRDRYSEDPNSAPANVCQFAMHIDGASTYCAVCECEWRTEDMMGRKCVATTDEALLALERALANCRAVAEREEAGA